MFRMWNTTILHPYFGEVETPYCVITEAILTSPIIPAVVCQFTMIWQCISKSGNQAQADQTNLKYAENKSKLSLHFWVQNDYEGTGRKLKVAKKKS